MWIHYLDELDLDAHWRKDTGQDNLEQDRRNPYIKYRSTVSWHPLEVGQKSLKQQNRDVKLHFIPELYVYDGKVIYAP